MRLLNSVTPTKPSSPVYHSPPMSKLVEMYGVRSGLPWLATCAEMIGEGGGRQHASSGSDGSCVREADVRSTMSSATSHAALNDGSHSA